MTTLSVTLARGADGSVDEAATLDACRAAVRLYVAQRETEQEAIGDAVSAVFDGLRGARANMPYVVSAALTRLDAKPENFKALGERVADFIREHAGDRESGATFGIGKGKGGGVVRWADAPVK